MAVIEYMLHKQGVIKVVPGFVANGGYWMSPLDYTLIGWIDDGVDGLRDYYVPETILQLSKVDFENRLLGIHHVEPYKKSVIVDGVPQLVDMTDEEVVVMADDWYDSYIIGNNPPPPFVPPEPILPPEEPEEPPVDDDLNE
jgi:hypothetical protein